VHAARTGEGEEQADVAAGGGAGLDALDPRHEGAAAVGRVGKAGFHQLGHGHCLAGGLVDGFQRGHLLGQAHGVALVAAQGLVGHVGRGVGVHGAALDGGQLYRLEAIAQRAAPEAGIAHAVDALGQAALVGHTDGVALGDGAQAAQHGRIGGAVALPQIGQAPHGGGGLLGLVANVGVREVEAFGQAPEVGRGCGGRAHAAAPARSAASAALSRPAATCRAAAVVSWQRAETHSADRLTHTAGSGVSPG
jgi:hypothetical protein